MPTPIGSTQKSICPPPHRWGDIKIAILFNWQMCLIWSYGKRTAALSLADRQSQKHEMGLLNRLDKKKIFFFHLWLFKYSKVKFKTQQYRCIPLSRTCLSRKNHLCRSDLPFLNIFPIFYFISTQFVSNSLNMKTLLFWSNFLFLISSFTLFYHPACVEVKICRPKRRHALFVNHLRLRNFLTSVIQKSNNLVDKVIHL